MNDVSLVDDLARLGLTERRVEERTDNELGQEDFMTLMIAQFRNQDPFEPMANGEFLGQLAQFSSVDGIDRLNQSFAGLSESIYSDQALMAANMVGNRVLAESSSAYLSENGAMSGAVDLEFSAQDIEIDVLDQSGQLVRQLSLGIQPPGLAAFEWDGLTTEREPAAPGIYRFEARVVRAGQSESAEVLTNTAVQSVSLGGPSGGLKLNVAGGAVLELDQVRQIL
jgi:flagellar basal-body rod modification protein FlgD